MCHATCGTQSVPLRVGPDALGAGVLARDDDEVAGPQRRHDVLVAGGDEGTLQRTRPEAGIHAEDPAVDLDDELLLAGERRRIGEE